MLKLNLENKEILNLDVIFLRNWPRPEDHFTYLANPRILVKYDNKNIILMVFVFPTLKKKKKKIIYIYTHTYYFGKCSPNLEKNFSNSSFIFLLDVNFENLTVWLNVLIISSIFAKFQNDKKLIAMSFIKIKILNFKFLWFKIMHIK